jgi:hypothetical protein
MGFTKTMSEILNLLPIVKNRKYKSAGVYMSETDTTFTGRTNKSETSDTDSTNDSTLIIDGKINKTI